MDPSQTVNTQTLAGLIHDQVTRARSPETKRVVLDLATAIGTKLQGQFGNHFNQDKWLQSCGITPEWREAVAA